MIFRLTAYTSLFFYLQFSLIFSAQSAEQESELASSSPPEEITITTQRTKLQLRLQLWEAEEKAYDVFNSFNDEKRFDIKCYLHEPTGTRIKHQVCTPEFQLIATREQARDRLNGTFQHVPVEFAIASQLDDYRKKIKQVAEGHTKFLHAVIEYTEKRQEYIEATGWVSKESE